MYANGNVAALQPFELSRRHRASTIVEDTILDDRSIHTSIGGKHKRSRSDAPFKMKEGRNEQTQAPFIKGDGPSINTLPYWSKVTVDPQQSFTETEGLEGFEPGPEIILPSKNGNKYEDSPESTGATHIARTLLNAADQYHDSPSSALPKQQPKEDGAVSDKPELGTTFDNLVDRLLSQTMSKADTKFVAMFLCLYRKFAAPSMLLSAIILRFGKCNDPKYPLMLRTVSQMRYLSILAQWINEHPGDFAHPVTRQVLISFVSGLAVQRTFSVAIREIVASLESVSVDDDTYWACSDATRNTAGTAESFTNLISVHSLSSTNDDNSSAEESAEITGIHETPVRDPRRNSTAQFTDSYVSQSASQSTGSFQALMNSIETAQKQAQLLVPRLKSLLSKEHWHQFVDMSDESISLELTRIDWIMLSSIRPRDLLRHVNLPADERDNYRSLENVTRMINHFNHVAFWVANIILLRDKPKHRAKALEKCMSIAWVSLVVKRQIDRV